MKNLLTFRDKQNKFSIGTRICVRFENHPSLESDAVIVNSARRDFGDLPAIEASRPGALA